MGGKVTLKFINCFTGIDLGTDLLKKVIIFFFFIKAKIFKVSPLEMKTFCLAAIFNFVFF